MIGLKPRHTHHFCAGRSSCSILAELSSQDSLSLTGIADMPKCSVVDEPENLKQRGYVALLDVLGFSDFIASDRQGETLGDYHSFIHAVMGSQDPPGMVEFVVFSDSIVLTIPSDKTDALLRLVTQCSRAFSMLLDVGIPIRGAISCGKYLRVPSDHGVFVAGSAIIDAYKYESLQNWVGIMLTPTAVSSVPNLSALCDISKLPATPLVAASRGKQTVPFADMRWAACVQHCPNIPFHSEKGAGGDYEGFAIVPGGGPSTPDLICRGIQNRMVKLKELKSLAPDPAAQRKYSHSYKWFNEVHVRWASLPQAFRDTYAQGRNDPP